MALGVTAVAAPAYVDLLKKRRWPEAVEVLRASGSGAERQTSGALFALSSALVYQGKVGEALKELFAGAGLASGDLRRQLISRIGIVSRLFQRNTTFQSYSEGLDLLSNGKWAAARDKLEQARQQEPENCEILTRLGQAHLLNGDADSAAERLREVRSLNPLLAAPRLWLARALHQRGETLPALNEFREVLPLLEGSEMGPIWYAEALVSAQMRPEAIVMLEETLKRQPYLLRAYLELARLRLREANGVWPARKDLQIIQSRTAEYERTPDRDATFELGLPARWEQARLDKEVSLTAAYIDQQLNHRVGSASEADVSGSRSE